MKKHTYCLLTMILAVLWGGRLSYASFAWTKMADFAPGEREFCFAFAIGDFGYAGTGRSQGVDYDDIWKYDPATDSWSQVANYPGSGRYGLASFSIGNFGYAGTGWSGAGGGGSQYRDFWKYDPSSNTWSPVADFGGSGRYSSLSFAIGNKGYMGTGYTGLQQDWWEYDPVMDNWTQKANYPHTVQAAAGFAIGNKGYVGTGYTGPTSYNDFYEYDPTNDVWTPKSSVPGLLRRGAVGFSVNSYGYLGMGYNDTTYLTDFHRYDPVNDQWEEVASIGGVPRYGAFAFSLNGFGYVGTGSYGGIISVIPVSDFYRISDCDGTTLGLVQHNIENIYGFMRITSQFNKGIVLDYDYKDEKNVVFFLYDALGHLVTSAELAPNSNHATITIRLSEAVYFYSVNNGEKVLGRGKVVVH